MNRFPLVIRDLVFAGVALAVAGCGTRGGETDVPDTPDLEAASDLRQRFPDQAAKVLEQDEGFIAVEKGFTLSPPGAAGTWRSLELTLPREATGTARMRVPGGFEVQVREVGAEGKGKVTENSVVYRRAGGTSFWTAAPGGYEEWLHLSATRRGEAAAAWEIEGATVRQQGEEVEVVDESGVPRIRVSAPVAYAAGGGEVVVKLKGEGARIELFVEGSGEVLVDPLWVPAASMITARFWHTATRLLDGSVLVAGGNNSAGTAVASAELYTPSTNTWAATGPMTITRAIHTATLLPNGMVLVTGGQGGFTQTTELYNPSTKVWSVVAQSIFAHNLHTATMLLNGKVLVVGGQQGEVYDPSTNTWTQTGPMNAGNVRDHTASLLVNGKVLIAGGSSFPGGGLWAGLANTYLYDSSLNTWAAGPAMSAGRFYHRAVTLPDNRVLVVGGQVDNAATYAKNADLYDPVANEWTDGGTMAAGRANHTVTLLQNGKVLAAGGGQSTAELFNPFTNTWTSAGIMSAVRSLHAATLLTNGTVLVTGGANVPTSEIYALSLGNPCNNNAQCQTGFCVDGVCCASACGGGILTDCQACNATGAEGVCSPATAGTVCGPTAGVCDVVESCNGVSLVCPVNGFKAAGTVCRAIAPGSAGSCDVAETCTGASAACPADAYKLAGVTCRASAGICDISEKCTGAGAACPQDAFHLASQICRASAGICDKADFCTGAGALCPPDAFMPAGTQCLNAAGVCSLAQACLGNGPNCPP